jgi:hypothetical protein
MPAVPAGLVNPRPLSELRDPHPSYSKQGYLVTIYCEQMHGCKRKLTEAELEVLHDAMEIPEGPQRAGRAKTGEHKNRSDNDGPKWLSASDVDPRWVYEWARNSLPGIPISPTEEEREFLSMGYQHLPARFRPTRDAALEVRWDEEDGFEVLNHLSPTITDIVLIRYSLPYAMHIRLLHDKGKAIWALYRDGKTLPTPIVLDPRTL